MWRQPKTVWAVAFACVIAFLGIGLVDPILKPIADELGASPSQVSLLFTSYLAVMGVAMLLTGWVSSRMGAKRTLLSGLAIIIVGSALAGMQDAVSGVVAFRAVWGLGNALFIATALATIVRAARGSVAQAIILYEAALGAGHRGRPPAWGRTRLGLVALALLRGRGAHGRRPARHGHSGSGLPARTELPTPITAPLHALSHRGLLTVALTALLYNFGFFTLLAFTPFPLDLSAHGVGLVFFGWGLLLALTSVVVAPWIQRKVGTTVGIVGALFGFAVILAVMAVWTEHKPVLVVGVVLAGAFLGINNTMITETVMKVAPVERGVASAAYSFVRFSGGAVAPWLAGKLGENSVHLPFWVGSVAVVAAIGVFLTGREIVRAAVDAQPGHGAEPLGSEVEAEAVTVGDA